MKTRSVLLLLLMSLHVGVTPADTVIGEVPDTLPGKGFGGLTGFMAGAGAGGPIGAVLGAGLGWLVGGETQKATGLSGQAYRVAREDGSEIIVRSPGRSWTAGDRVGVVGGRLVAAGETDSAISPVSALTY